MIFPSHYFVNYSLHFFLVVSVSFLRYAFESCFLLPQLSIFSSFSAHLAAHCLPLNLCVCVWGGPLYFSLPISQYNNISCCSNMSNNVEKRIPSFPWRWNFVKLLCDFSVFVFGRLTHLSLINWITTITTNIRPWNLMNLAQTVRLALALILKQKVF